MDYAPIFETLAGGPLDDWLSSLPAAVEAGLSEQRWGDLPRWRQALQQLPLLRPSRIALDSPAVTVGEPHQLAAAQRDSLHSQLAALHPWRKGPFNLFGLTIDTEWRSDWKWDRLAPHIAPLAGRTVLDVGCGSGYHCWRMRGAGAQQVVGIDPGALFVCQYWALQHYIRDYRVAVLPLALEQLPTYTPRFDTVFSMGVLYHRRSPFDHLQQLRDLLNPGGELVLETLVIEGGADQCLLPRGRYARMGNVWFIPSCDMLCLWLEKMRFRDIRVADVTATTSAEQRSTEWMRFHSLADFLDPSDPGKTVEGYPAPRRAILTATAP